MTRFGRSEEQWNELVDAATDFLLERARLERLTSYRELNTTLAARTGQPAWDFALEADRAAMGEVLGRVTDFNRADADNRGIMLSALVEYLNENRPAPGFFAYARQLGLLTGSSRSAEDDFWLAQVRAIFEHYRPARRR